MNIGGTVVADLTGNERFPDDPDQTYFLPYFEWNPHPDGINTPPNNAYGDNYGAQIIGYFHPPSTGNYTFWICSDDQGELWLSTDSTAANKQLIAREPSWNNPRDWTGADQAATDRRTVEGVVVNVSAPINLQAGQAYYIEALLKEGGGGDNLAVAVQDPAGAINPLLPIPGQYLSTIDKTSGPATIVTAPQSVTVTELSTVSFMVEADGTPPYTYQWTKNGTPLADGANVSGATSATLTLSTVPLADNNAQIAVTVTGAEGAPSTSSAAALTVTADTEAPTLVSASATATGTTVLITFSKPVDQTSAQTAANYQIAGLTVSAPTLVEPDQVRLTTTAQAQGQAYTITVNNVRDRTAAGNVIAANSTIGFTAWVYIQGRVERYFYDGIGGGSVNDLINNPNFPDNPTSGALVPGPDHPDRGMDNYGTLYRGYITLPTGDYDFYISSDDNSQLWLSSDMDPVNLELICVEPEWNGYRAWASTDRRGTNPLGPANASFSTAGYESGVSFVTGQRRYFEILHKEGGGGDNFSMTWAEGLSAIPANGTVPVWWTDSSAFSVAGDPSLASIEITSQPQNQTTDEFTTATFSVVAAGQNFTGGALGYQWQMAPSGSTAFTDIAGAIQATYTTPQLTLADNGRQYRVTISAAPLPAENSAAATLTVSPDTTPPTVVSAGALSGSTSIGVYFDEPIAQASADLAANYRVNGAAPASARYVAHQVAVLTVNTPPAAGFTVSAPGVTDLAGNPAGNQTVTGAIVADFTSEEIAPTFLALPGQAVAIAADGFYIEASGADIWGANDEFQYVYKQFSGPLDMRVRVESVYRTVDGFLSGNDNVGSTWAKAALMVREALTPDARNEVVLVTPNAGVNLYNHQWRPVSATDLNSGSKPGGERLSPTVFPSWIRLVREDAASNEFKSYLSFDEGATWMLYHTHTMVGDPLASQVYVGMALTSHDNLFLSPAAFTGFSVQAWTPPLEEPLLSVEPQPNGDLMITFEGTLQEAGAIGDWSNTTLTSPATVTPAATGNKFYRSTR